MNAKRVVAVLVLALAAYAALIGYRGIYLLGQHRIGLQVLGVAVLALPLIGIYVVIAELRFGAATQRLGARLGPDDLPDLPRTASGRVERAAADKRFELRRADVEADPSDWRAWYRLALAYDDAGDRKRARSTMRQAITLANR